MELKPCPFCGNKDIGVNYRTEENQILSGGKMKFSTLSERWQIKCRNCLCGTYFGFHLEDVVEVWNRRANDEH